MRYQAKKRHRWYHAIAIFLALFMVSGMFMIYAWEKNDLAQETDVSNIRKPDMLRRNLTAYYNGQWYRYRDNVETYLILGIDKFSDMVHEDFGNLVNNLQSDVLLLAVVDNDFKTYKAIQINRDTMAEIRQLGYSGQKTGTIVQQLALSHTYGSGGKDSCRNTANAVSRLFYDIPIDHYYAVTMDSVSTLADLVDGIKVHIEDDMTAIDKTFQQGTDIVLKGQSALNYVRARKTVADGTNLNRMKRQYEFMNSLQQKILLKLEKNKRFAFTLAGALEDYSTTDMITDQMVNLMSKLRDYTFTGIENINGETVLGEKYMEFYPNENQLRAMTITTFFEQIS